MRKLLPNQLREEPRRFRRGANFTERLSDNCQDLLGMAPGRMPGQLWRGHFAYSLWQTSRSHRIFRTASARIVSHSTYLLSEPIILSNF